MEWFKMRNIWGKPVSRLSDAEAGRFIKAVFRFMNDFEEFGGQGREEFVTVEVLETLRKERDEYVQREEDAKKKREMITEKRREAARTRWNNEKKVTEEKEQKKVQNDSGKQKVMQNNAFASTCMQNDAFAYKCSDLHNLHPFALQNKNIEEDIEINREDIYTRTREREPESLLTDTEMDAIRKRIAVIPDIERVCRACGMRFDQEAESIVLELLNDYTADEITNAVSIANKYHACNWAYIRKVIEGRHGQDSGTAQGRKSVRGNGTQRGTGGKYGQVGEYL